MMPPKPKSLLNNGIRFPELRSHENIGKQDNFISKVNSMKSNSNIDSRNYLPQSNNIHSNTSQFQGGNNSRGSNSSTMGYGMPYDMGMSMGYNPYMTNGPFSWIYSLNHFVNAIGQFSYLIGMNAQAILNLYQQIISTTRKLIYIIENSTFRRWLRLKCEKSKFLRVILIAGSMIVTYQTMKLIKLFKKTSTNQLSNKLSY